MKRKITTLLSLSILLGLSGCDLLFFKSQDREFKNRIAKVPVQDYRYEPFGPYTYSLKYEDKLPKPVPYDFAQTMVQTPESLMAESKKYFEHLCNTEAGNYIWKTVRDVDSVALLRSTELPAKSIQTFKDFEKDNPGYDFRKYGFAKGPIVRKKETFSVTDYLDSPIALEAPLFFNQFLAGKLEGASSYPPEHFGNRYASRINGGEDYFRFVDSIFYAYKNSEHVYNNGVINNYFIKERRPQEAHIFGKEQVKLISSRYAITWRGFQRPRDREFGIAGSDMIIVDLKTNEVLAVHRNFGLAIRQFEYKPTRISWHLPLACFETYKNERSYQYSPSTPFNEKFKMMNRVTNEGILPPFVQNTLLPADPERLSKVKPIINKAN